MISKLSFIKAKFIAFVILLFLSSIIIFNFNIFPEKLVNGSEFNENGQIFNYNLKISKISGKIHIDNNWTATKNAGICTGNGTYSNPYIIEDLVINGGGSGSCIWIENSDVHFKIENCTLFNSGNYWDDSGIRLFFVRNAQIINNTCLDNFYGIYISASSNNTISENIVNHNRDGIYLVGGAFNNISKNKANHNIYFGITSYANQYNVITENIVSNNIYGIELEQSFNNTISSNIMNKN
ncbi:MAG: right-handed parallel beta-helix repeat-containing protein, partial [Candidatus Thorarchaeota archaeon]